MSADPPRQHHLAHHSDRVLAAHQERLKAAQESAHRVMAEMATKAAQATARAPYEAPSAPVT